MRVSKNHKDGVRLLNAVKPTEYIHPMMYNEADIVPANRKDVKV